MTRDDIEEAARNLLIEMWGQRALLCPERRLRPIEILEPGLAAKFLLVDFEIADQIGNPLSPFAYRGDRFETAGLMDRQSRRIVVSRRFPRETMVFTAAHEIGHWVLHDDEVVHRDRPIDGVRYGNRLPREPKEREADYFAACFLMPVKLMLLALEERFSTVGPLIMNDDVAYMLCPQNPNNLLKGNQDERACAVASAKHYGTKHFIPLHRQFGVSISTMAIRLKELGLVT